MAELQWGECNDCFNCRIIELILNPKKLNLKTNQLGSSCLFSKVISKDQKLARSKNLNESTTNHFCISSCPIRTSYPHSFFFYLKMTPRFESALLAPPIRRSKYKVELLALEGTCVHGRLLHPWDLTHVYLQLSEWKQGSDNVKSRETRQYRSILKISNQKILVLFWVWRVLEELYICYYKSKN